MTVIRLCAVFAVIFAVAVQWSGAQVALVNVVPEASNSTCLNATKAQLAVGVNCSSVGYALRSLANYIDDTPSNTITVYYNHSFTQDEITSIQLAPASAGVTLAITGFNNTMYSVDCSGTNSGVSFVGFQTVSVAYLSWYGCGVQHNTTAYYTWLDPSLFPIKAFSALFFIRSGTVNITHCLFTNSTHGSGVSIYDSTNILVLSSDFTNNKVSGQLLCNSTSENTTCSPQATGLYIETTLCGGFTNLNCPSSAMAVHKGGNYLVSHCRFVNNVNREAYASETKHAVPTSVNDHWPFGKGGGFNLALRGNVTQFQVTIEDCIFLDNNGNKGGGMTVELHPSFSGVVLAITECLFTNNTAIDNGGGLRLGVLHEQTLETVTPSNITLYNCTFQENSAKRWGGGTSMYSGTNTQLVSRLDITNCSWISNHAHRSAPALGITSSNSQLGNSPKFTFFPQCLNCTFWRNSVTLVTGHSRAYGYGAVFLQGVPMAFMGITVFQENTESGLCISSTSVELHGFVWFSNNKGVHGGAIFLTGTSWINLTPNLKLLFFNNTATQDGGAIYYTYPPSLSLWDFKDCFIQYSNRTVPFHQWNVTVAFAHNLAFESGDAVYVSNSQECTWSEGHSASNPFEATNINACYPFNYDLQKPREKAVSTPPAHISFDQLSANYSYRDKLWYEYSIMPGATLNLNVEITDYFGNRTSSVVSTACHNVSDYLEYSFQKDLCVQSSKYSIEGLSSTFGLNNSLKDLQIRGPPHSKILYVLVTNDLQPIVVPLLISLTDCKYGFVLSNSTGSTAPSCVCFSQLPTVRTDNFLCIDDKDTVIPCIRNGYWFGEIGQKKNGVDVHGTQTCLYGTCTKKCQPCGHLPTHEWCKLPEQPSQLCKRHRNGPLCSQCKPGFSLTYDSFSCTSCSVRKAVGLWLLFAVYWAFILLQLIAIIKLDLRVGSGYMYIFLYYFSVLKYIMWYSIPENYLTVPLNLFGTLTRLDPLLYVYTNLCLFSGVTSVQYEAFHYIHPLVILTVVMTLITLGYFCSRFTIFSGNYAIQALCYVLLLAYTSLAETSLNLLNPLKYPTTYPSVYGEAFVQIQPGTTYMHPTEHLPYALLALVVEITIVLPFSIFMLVAPLLMRHVNLIKLKPILDEYQSCYKDRYRWFAGVYLVGRQLFFLTSIWSIDYKISLLLNQIFCTIILVLHATIHPYRQRWLNYVDTFFLADLTLLTFLYSGGGIASLPWSSNARKSVVTILILLPCLYFLFLLTVGLTRYIRKRKRRNTVSSPLVNIGPTSTQSVADDEFPSRLLEEESKSRSHSHSQSPETQPLLRSEGKEQSWYKRLGAGLSAHSRQPERDKWSASSSASNNTL